MQTAEQPQLGLSPRNPEKILEDLRRLYRKKQWATFKKEFYRNSFFLPQIERKKIMDLIPSLPAENQGNIDETDNLEQYCIDTLGWKKVDY